MNSGYLLFFESTIMGDTAELAKVQKTIIDTLHKESKTQRGITERGGCSRSAVSKHIKSEVDWKEEIGWKMCTSNRDDRKLENTVKQSRFKHLGELHKEWTEAEAQTVFRKRATKPLLNQKQRQKHLTWAKEKHNWTVTQWFKVLFSDASKFCISFVNQGPRVWRKRGETQNPRCLKSSVKFPVSDDLGCRDICWCWSIVFYQARAEGGGGGCLSTCPFATWCPKCPFVKAIFYFHLFY